MNGADEPHGAADPVVRVDIELAGRQSGYRVHIEVGARSRLADLLYEAASAERYAVIADDRVAELYADEVVGGLRADGLDAALFTFPAGEASKSRSEWARLGDALLESGLGRRSTVVALGGGVTGDLAGFVAATHMRGVPIVQVPTTLLAMVDASVGGKTGVNVPGGKNLVGAFHPPALVVVDPEFTRTLPRARRCEGLAEAVKHGAIRDAGHLTELVSWGPAVLDGDPGATARAVERSVRIKGAVVGADEREAGLREILNFGHTLGHGLEAASGFELSHGAAVALGMVLEADLGERLGVTEAGTAAALVAALSMTELPTSVPLRLDPARVMAAIGRDKKVRDESLRVVLLEALGRVHRTESGWSQPVARDLVRALIDEACAEAQSA